MKNAQRKFAKKCIPILISAILLSACKNSVTTEPTAEMNVFSTTISQTMEAEYTASAAVLPTEIPAPTETMNSQNSQSEDNSGSVVVLPIPAVNSGEAVNTTNPDQSENTEEQMIKRNNTLPDVTVQPTIAIPTATAARSDNDRGDKAAYESQSPEDGAHVERGSEFDVIWYLKNTGTTTWTKDYCLRYFTGTNFTKPGKNRYYLSKTVGPDETAECIVDALAPDEPGTYKMSVVLGNENDKNFFIVDITIVVD